MSEKIKSDYIKFVFSKAKADLKRYNINSSDKILINDLFNRLMNSENLLRDTYILSHIKDFKKIGRYFTFMLKKIDDNVINFDNLLRNIDSDTEFIENEILNFLSNPKLHENLIYNYENEEDDSGEKTTLDSKENIYNEAKEDSKISEENIIQESEEEEVTDFKKNYLELIQSEENEEETVYELPVAGESDNTAEEDTASLFLNPDKNDNEKVSEEEETEEEVSSPREESNEPEVEITESIESTSKDSSGDYSKGNPEEADLTGEEDDIEESNIVLSDEIQEELNLFDEQQKNAADKEALFEEDSEEIIEEPPTNAAFIEYESLIKENNDYLNIQFDKMISALSWESGADETRDDIIKNILERSIHTENISRNMSLEVISNIYQTITLSFEKIADGKYDLSESTLNLFKKGLSLISSLIKGDDYFGYKDILKSIENIRSSLLEEKEKRELYLRQLKEKEELKRQINEKFPDDSQKLKIASLKKLIKDTEMKFNSLEKISGEYQIYEALRSLSGNLNNFKDIVILSKELGLQKLVQLAEASYIFVKFLQNYRINPVSIESKEIFGYIIYNLKSIVVGKQVEDIDIFISYLNDPVKIFSKTEKKKT